jgi:hypothetical protein
LNEQVKDKPISTAQFADVGERQPESNPVVHDPKVRTQPGAPDPHAVDERPTPLLATGDADHFRARWQDVQTGFVDEPRRAVEQADALVAELMKRLAESFASERSQLEQKWDQDRDVSTEDLRVALQRYRSFFSRLLSV